MWDKDINRARYGKEGERASLRRERAKEEGEGAEECLSRLIPNRRENKLPAKIGDMHKYPQFSEK
jgi:hypothetical protein